MTRELGPSGPSMGLSSAAEAVIDSQNISSLDEPPEVEEAELTHGDFVGRYSVLSRLGQGGMGVVYKAYDPQLDRNVALKLLRRSRSSVEADLRLLQEAQTLAKLKHPNIVAVYDAGLASHGVFIAMELLDGCNLNAWLEQQPRTVSQILQVFRAAGRGLLAAHEAGFVHRDFKPSNINVGEDGQVRVLDFGLAHLVENGPGRSPAAAVVRERIVERPTHPTSSLDSASGTEKSLVPGAVPVMGTPAFMAPEQFVSGQVDQRSEQFAVAMSLYVALYDRSPLGGATYEERQETLERGLRLSEVDLERSASGERVPYRIRRVIVRGLATDPSERFESMQQMLAELEEPRRRWREALAALALLIGFGGGAVVFGDDADPPCSDPAAALQGTWSEGDRSRVDAAFERVAPANTSSRQRVFEQLDEYATAWVQMYEESCRATFVVQRQSERLFDQRMRCLDRRHNRLRNAIESLASVQTQAQLVQRVIAPFKLPQLEPCADLDYVESEQSLPEQADRERVAELRAQLDEAMTQHDIGDYAAGIALAEEVLRGAESIEHAPLLAEALESLGKLQIGGRRAAEAEPVLERAIRVGSAARVDRTVAMAWTRLLFAKASQRKLDEGKVLELPARAAVDRVGDPIIEAWLLNNLGYLEGRRGEQELSLDYMRKAQALKIESLGEDHVDVGISWLNLGGTLSEHGEYDEARPALVQAKEIFEATVGPAHPLSRSTQWSLGLLELRAENPAAAIAPLQAARVDYEGAPPGWVARCSFLLAQAQWQTGEPEEARAAAEQARVAAGDNAKILKDIDRWEQDPRAYEAKYLRPRAALPKPRSPEGDNGDDEASEEGESASVEPDHGEPVSGESTREPESDDPNDRAADSTTG